MASELWGVHSSFSFVLFSFSGCATQAFLFYTWSVSFFIGRTLTYPQMHWIENICFSWNALSCFICLQGQHRNTVGAWYICCLCALACICPFICVRVCLSVSGLSRCRSRSQGLQVGAYFVWHGMQGYIRMYGWTYGCMYYIDVCTITVLWPYIYIYIYIYIYTWWLDPRMDQTTKPPSSACNTLVLNMKLTQQWKHATCMKFHLIKWTLHCPQPTYMISFCKDLISWDRYRFDWSDGSN